MVKDIGSLSHNTMTGTVAPPVNAAEALEKKPGEDYIRYRKTGYQPRPAEIRTVVFLALGQGAVRIAAEADLVGTTVTIVDSHGASFSNCRILDTRTIRNKRVIHNGAAQEMVETAWTVQQGDPTGGGS